MSDIVTKGAVKVFQAGGKPVLRVIFPAEEYSNGPKTIDVELTPAQAVLIGRELMAAGGEK